MENRQERYIVVQGRPDPNVWTVYDQVDNDFVDDSFNREDMEALAKKLEAEESANCRLKQWKSAMTALKRIF